ncbi:porin [Bartonella sp. LJL80]
MNIKSLLLGSAAALVAVSGARAADVVVAEPEPVEYVRVCDAYGAGYFYIPGTETCMRISGYVRADIKGGDNVGARQRGDIDRDTYAWRTRATLRFHTASETELGTLRTFIELRSQWDKGAEWGSNGDSASGQLRFAYIELGGLRVGLDESIFNHWTGYYGNVINDDIVNPMAYTRTNVISYTFNNGNGFSAILGVEQGNDDGDSYGESYYRVAGNDSDIFYKGHVLDQRIDDYTPNFVGGLKFVQGWGGISAVAAYDAYYEEWAGKVRLDLNVTDQWNVWVMGGYKSADDRYADDDTYGVNGYRYNANRNLTTLGVYRQINSIYGDWGGDWAVWGGTTFKFNPKTSFNAQVSYDDTDTFAASVNVKYELVPGLVITPELTYVSWDNDFSMRSYDRTFQIKDSMKGQDAFQGMVRIQRSF